jgi:hypothetical protein
VQGQAQIEIDAAAARAAEVSLLLLFRLLFPPHCHFITQSYAIGFLVPAFCLISPAAMPRHIGGATASQHVPSGSAMT